MPIKINDQTTWPVPGSSWKHTGGNVYVVLGYTNVEEIRQDEYPTTIIYANLRTDRKYSRPLKDWDRSMTEILPQLRVTGDT